MIRAVDLWKTYDGKPVISGFSHEFRTGARYALMGRSGSGKTTLLRLLMGLETPDRGYVETEADLQLSAVFQEDRLFEHLSAIRNITLASGASSAEAEALLIKLELPRESLSVPASTLSGGMKRRTALARALLAPHSVLFLDEPYKGLDPETRERVHRLVLQKEAGRTLILVTHDLADAEGMETIRTDGPSA